MKEQNIGEFAGMKYNELYKLTKKLGIYSSFWLMEERYVPPKGESFTQLNDRVKQFLYEKILDKLQGNIVIFSHGGPIKAAIAHAIKADPNYTLPFWIDNLAVSRFDFLDSVCRVRFINLLPKIIYNSKNVYEGFI